MKRIFYLIVFTLLSCGLFAQGQVTTEPSGLNADREGKILFTASSSSPLYNHTGDVYVHIGVVDNNGVWNNVPAAWGENTAKCRMTREDAHVWSIALSPTVRQWFGSDANQAITKIGVVFRNEDGTKKGIQDDRFITVTDENLYVTLQTTPASGICGKGTQVKFQLDATQTADLSLEVNGESVASKKSAQTLSFDKSFDTEGRYRVKATASNGTKTVVQETSLFVYGGVANQTKPAGTKDGINVTGDRSVTFVLYDKDTEGKGKDFAFLIGDFNNWEYSDASRMYRDETAGCWWATLENLDPDTEYAFQYLIGASNETPIRLADAYCEKTLDPDDRYIPESVYPGLREYPSDKTSGIVSVFKIRETPYPWEVTGYCLPAPDKMVIYELHLRDFTETGDLAGAIEKLDYLKSLGVNAVELMPVQEFDGNDSWGYNPRFFFALDKAYGTKNDYKRFIDECHKREMGVIFDVVYNHATGSHPFAQLYWDSNSNKTAANNPWFNVNPPHPYDFFHDFNHESPLVREHVKRNLAFLLEEYNIDGFRFDFTKGFTQKVTTDNTQSAKDDSRIAILKDYHAAVKAANPGAVMILEHLCDESEERVLAQDGMYLWRNMNHAYCQAIMGFGSQSSFEGIYANGTGMPKASLVGYMESHDEERLMYKAQTWGLDEIKADQSVQLERAGLSAAFSMLIPGPKMIWQFGELGYDYSIDYNDRVGRKPVRWDYFDEWRRRSLYNEYVLFTTIREDYPEMFGKNAEVALSVSGSNLGSARKITLRGNDNQILVIGNFSTSDITAVAGFPSTGTWHEIPAGTSMDVTNVTQSLTVPANGYRIFSKENISSGMYAGEERRVSVYPNPTVASVYFTDGAEMEEVTLYNASGAQCAVFRNVGHIDLSGYPAGCYVLKVKNETQAFVLRVLKN